LVSTPILYAHSQSDPFAITDQDLYPSKSADASDGDEYEYSFPEVEAGSGSDRDPDQDLDDDHDDSGAATRGQGGMAIECETSLDGSKYVRHCAWTCFVLRKRTQIQI
jgi:hypothetical protein